MTYVARAFAPDWVSPPGSTVAAWLRQGEREAELITCIAFDKTVFRQVLNEARQLTNEGDPAVFIPRLVKACARAGVAVVLVPAPKGCPVSGATRWLRGWQRFRKLTKAYRLLRSGSVSRRELWLGECRRMACCRGRISTV